MSLHCRSFSRYVIKLIFSAVVIYLLIMIYVTFIKLKESKPAIVLILAFALFAGGQVVQFLASQPLCRVSLTRRRGRCRRRGVSVTELELRRWALRR